MSNSYLASGIMLINENSGLTNSPEPEYAPYEPDYRNSMYTVGNSIYAVCKRCGSLVKLNKWLFGSLHICD